MAALSAAATARGAMRSSSAARRVGHGAQQQTRSRTRRLQPLDRCAILGRRTATARPAASRRAARSQDQSAGRGAGDAAIEQRRHRQRQQAARLGRACGLNQRDTLNTPRRRQPVEEDLPALARVEAVLGQRERAGAGRGPRVDQRHLQDVEPLRRPRQVRPRLVVHERHVRIGRRCRRSRDSAALRRRSTSALLISMPVTDVLPPQIAESTSRPPPTPMTATSPLPQVIGAA